MSIFVSVAAFCDPLLRFTLDGLFSRARHPHRLQVAVIDQSLDDNRRWLDQAPYRERVHYLNIHPVEARGVSWARHIAFSYYGGEDYLLQIDSHTMFEPEWDSKLVGLLQELSGQAAKPIISTYPPPFQFDEQGGAKTKFTSSNSVVVLRPHPDTRLTEDNATLRFRAHYLRGPRFAEGVHLAAGFIFTLGRFVEEIPYDPFLYFHGEEQSLAVRAYTHGWRIFHPRQKDIPLYHLYRPAGEENRAHHWHRDHEQHRIIKWTTLKKRSDARLRRLVYGDGLGGVYGLGNVKTLQDFAAAGGIDYPSRQLREPAGSR